MDITEGSLSYKIGLDYSEVLKGARQVLAALGDVDAAMGAFGKIDDWSDITKESLKTQKEYIKQLEAEYERLGKAIEELPDGARKTSALSQYKAIGEEIDEERKSLLDMEDAMKANELATARLQVQYRGVIAEMQRLKGLGMDTSEEYASLADKAKELKDAMEGVNNELKPQNMTLSTMASGITTVTGAMSAAMGVVSLFGDKSERLNEIMMKMQSLMAITVGLQQVSTNLSRQSTLMLGIEAVQRSAAAKAAMMQAKGTAAATIAQKAFNVVAKANPYVLLAAAIVTVVGAIAAFSRGTKVATDRAKELKELSEDIANEAAKPVAQIEKLSFAWSKLGDDMGAKKKFIEDNAEAFERLGVNVKSVADAENLLIDNKGKFIEAQIEKARAMAANSKAQEIMAKRLEAELKKENTPEFRKVVTGDINEITGEYDTDEFVMVKNRAYEKIEEEIKGYDDRLKMLYGISADAESSAIGILKDANIDAWRQYEDGTVGAIRQAIADKRKALDDVKDPKEYKAIEDEIKRLESSLAKITGKNGKLDPEAEKRRLEQYLSELKKVREKAEDLEIANMGDNSESRERKIRTDYGRQIAEAEAKALAASTPELAEAYRKQADELRKAMESAVKEVYDNEAKKQKEAFDEILEYYGDYTYAKRKLDEQYQKDLGAATLAFFAATTEEEKRIYAGLIRDIGKDMSKQTLDLSLSKIDATAYDTVEAKMDAINKAYGEYIANLVKAGASEAEINAALREQVKTTGVLASLEAKIQDYEEQKALAVERGDIDLVERLNEEIRILRKRLKETQDQMGQKSFGTAFKEWWDERTVTGAIDAMNEMNAAIASIAEAAGNDAIAEGGRALSAMGDVAKRIATGDYLGAALQVITSIGMAIAEDTAKVREFEAANRQAAVEADLLRITMAMTVDEGVFGSDSVAQAEAYVRALEMATEGTERFKKENTMDEMRMKFPKYADMFEKTFKVLDRNAWGEIFGGGDEWMSLSGFAAKNNLELYDAYGNLNADVLQLFKDTYEDIDEEDKRWIDNAIKYSEEYADAMAGLTSYLQSLFGDMADTIADQFVDTFLEGGEAAMDFSEVVSGVSRKMAKDFVKNMLMEEVFAGYEKEFKAIMTGNGTAEEKQRLMLANFTAMQADAEALQPAIQQYLETMSQFFGQSSDLTSQAGNLLQNATQDSIDLVNGQMNAIRMNQMRIADSVDGIILQLGHIHNDMNNGFDRSVDMLTQINMNVRSTERSMLNGFGLLN